MTDILVPAKAFFVGVLLETVVDAVTIGIRVPLLRPPIRSS